MRTLPDGIEVGDTLTQEEIEDAYSTGFGYRISGINPRRDEHDRRYILLFANEDGPYSDSVTQGRFEYIGEGLEGNQSEGSPGNSALIDATTSGIPVHFFYKGAEGEDWEYQGLVDVVDYQFREQGGREVLVFTMEHRKQSNDSPDRAGLYLTPVSDYWRDKFRDTVERSLDLTQYDNVPPQLEGYSELRIWATTETSAAKKQAAIDQMGAGDCVLFYSDGNLFAGGIVERAFESPAVGELIWNQPESRHVYILSEFTTDVPSLDRIWGWLDYNGRQVVQGFSRVDDSRLAQLREEFGSVQDALFGGKEPEVLTAEIKQEKGELAEITDSPPHLTEDQEQYTESRRRARDSAFTELVKDTYNNQCAICGSERETPDGSPEVEAAHIYPKREGGSDDVRNGIALCKLHHWAFDSGWLSLSDEHEILVKEAPNRNGYYEFKQLQCDLLQLPAEEELSPHPIFLEGHRRIHGFNHD
jgi:putative restriction endonuclease